MEFFFKFGVKSYSYEAQKPSNMTGLSS